jgi:diguanylate cyclase (GGDEF)-like protein
MVGAVRSFPPRPQARIRRCGAAIGSIAAAVVTLAGVAAYALVERMPDTAAIVLLTALLTQTVVVVIPLVRANAKLARAVDALAVAATTDPATGALTRRSFHERCAIELQKASRYRRPLGLLMLDFGVSASGIERSLLHALTAQLAAGTRTVDLIAHLGGTAFAILAPETDLRGAAHLAERLRERIADTPVPVGEKRRTIAIGVTAAERGAILISPLLARAGDALAEAQSRGRNHVVVRVG